MIRTRFAMTIMATLVMVGAVHAQTARDYITIVGSYVITPLATEVADRLKKAAVLKKSPEIQGIGTDAGFKQFCAGSGIDTPDIVLGTRPVKSSEMETCKKNGVKEMVELKIGYTAIVVARQGEEREFKDLTRKDLFLAMAKDIPDPEGSAKIIPNPYKNWNEINAKLPDSKIQLWGPNASYAIQGSIISEIMVEGCKQIPALKALEATDPKTFETVCRSFRKDNVYNEYKEHTAAIQDLKNNSNILGIFSDTFLRDTGLTNLPIDGIEPLPGSISHNLYPLTRPLLLYVKKSHATSIPGLKDYLTEITSEAAISTRGYLLDWGLVPMPLLERQQTQSNASELKTLPLQ
mgnify:CR=1 FL=1